jgi:hypothetical protein
MPQRTPLRTTVKKEKKLRIKPKRIKKYNSYYIEIFARKTFLFVVIIVWLVMFD